MVVLSIKNLKKMKCRRRRRIFLSFSIFSSILERILEKRETCRLEAAMPNRRNDLKRVSSIFFSVQSASPSSFTSRTVVAILTETRYDNARQCIDDYEDGGGEAGEETLFSGMYIRLYRIRLFVTKKTLGRMYFSPLFSRAHKTHA